MMTLSINDIIDPVISPENFAKNYNQALSKRRSWESLWQECYDYALPNQSVLTTRKNGTGGQRKTDHIFDATAMDAADILASSLMAQISPPWQKWFALEAGPELTSEQAQIAARNLQKLSAQISAQFDQSNFAIEIHQCYLDLVTIGTACIAVHEAMPGAPSSLKFEAIPMQDIILAENDDGVLSNIYRPQILTGSDFNTKFSNISGRSFNADDEVHIIEAVLEINNQIVKLCCLIEEGASPILLAQEILNAHPYIAFRWQKASSEQYGRSPVMKVLPDIKTANKVVELILKNASLAVTGIWQADDDGVLNPTNVKLEPGTIIPKAVGSQGLKPLEMSGNFDVSQLILSDLRSRIRSAMLVDRLTQPNGAKMTATEVMERSAQNATLFSAIYGRLQSELLTPLLDRVMDILIKRGDIPYVEIDSARVCLKTYSPLSQVEKQKRMQSLMSWLDAAKQLGGDTLDRLDKTKLLESIAIDLGVPTDLIIQAPQPLTPQDQPEMETL